MAKCYPTFILKNCTLYADRENRMGQVSEITTPDIETVTVEFLNGGMVKKREVDMGVLNALTLGFKETAIDPGMLKLLNKPDTEYMAVGVLRDADGGNHQDAVLYFRGDMKKLAMGSWKAGEKSEVDYEISAHYLKLEIGDDEIYELTDCDTKIGGESIYGYSDSMLHG